MQWHSIVRWTFWIIIGLLVGAGFTVLFNEANRIAVAGYVRQCQAIAELTVEQCELLRGLRQ